MLQFLIMREDFWAEDRIQQIAAEFADDSPQMVFLWRLALFQPRTGRAHLRTGDTRHMLCCVRWELFLQFAAEAPTERIGEIVVTDLHHHFLHTC